MTADKINEQCGTSRVSRLPLSLAYTRTSTKTGITVYLFMDIWWLIGPFYADLFSIGHVPDSDYANVAAYEALNGF